jgi:hypothetical protein
MFGRLPFRCLRLGHPAANRRPALDLIAAAAYNGAFTTWGESLSPMQSRPPARLIDRAAAALLRQARGWTAALGCIALVVVASVPDPAWGQYRGGSGGYSRPSVGGSGSFSTRRPAIGGSGGYRRPSSSAPVFGGSSPGDRAMSRGRSSEALRDYRASQRPPPAVAPARPPASPPAADRGWGAPMPRREPSWGGGWGAVSPRRSFGTGVVTGFALWAALNALTSSPGQAEYFYAHRNAPTYREWRQEAERIAARDPAVAANLAELDRRMAQLEATPGSTGGGPALAREPAREPEDGFSLWGIVFVVGGVVVLVWLWRRRAARPGIPVAGVPPGLAGSAESRFRVGMVLPVDQAPFLLASGLTKIQPPDESGTISVEAVGLLRYGNVSLHRLYLPGGHAFFQLHLGADGRPDECRYFSLLDEVAPADRQEWGFWLDPREGMIGWPTFQTKDGKLYARVWAPGQNRIAPRQIEETRQYVDRVERRSVQAMLYGAPTGATAAAPQTEYILVNAIEADGQAWVEIDAGIDINPAALQLPGVPLTP